MDLLVEDGTGLVTANAYATVAEVDALLSVNIASKWSLIIDQTAKAALVMWATRILDERVRWFGCKMYPTSGTAWPRQGVRDGEGFPIDDNLVPRQVKLATAVMAEHLINGNPEIVNTASNLTSLQVDVIALKFDVTLFVAKYPREISYIIAGLGRFSNGRGGPKFIIKH